MVDSRRTTPAPGPLSSPRSSLSLSPFPLLTGLVAVSHELCELCGTSTARECVDSPQKVRLYGDRPPLIAAADAARQKAQVPIWEREERERQQFLGQVPAHLQACSAPPSLLPLADLLLQCQQVAPLYASPHARSTLRTLSLRVSGQ